jgi:hypothetical protein
LEFPSGRIAAVHARAGKVLELSQREALLLGYDYVGTEHLLLAIVRKGESVACQAGFSLGVRSGPRPPAGDPQYVEPG